MAVSANAAVMHTDVVSSFTGGCDSDAVTFRPRVEEDPKMLIWILELLWSTNLHVSCPQIFI